MDRELESRAAVFAAEVVRLATLVHRREGADCVSVSTAELCKAMDKPRGATNDEVRRFSLAVQRHLGPLGMTAACGCGHLALQVMVADAMDRAVGENRDLEVFCPKDITAYLTSHDR